MEKVFVTVVILTKNAASTLKNTLDSVAGFHCIIAIDEGSDDDTIKILNQARVRIIKVRDMNFSQKRTAALNLIDTDWIFYVDSDEVVCQSLFAEIKKIVRENQPAAYRILRRNIFLGKEMYPDQVDRLFHKSVIVGWTGAVHESPVINVEPKLIHEPLIHYTHRSIESMLSKTNQWSETEADLRIEANHPKMSWWRLLRIGLTTFIGEYTGKKLWRYGRPGLFEAYFQMIDKLIVYTKLWERQHLKN